MTETEKMAKAFELVDPVRFGGKDWREPVNAFVSEAALAKAGVTLEEVTASVSFYTATEANVSVPIAMAEGGTGYLVRALGYRRGPAGP